MTNKWSPPEIRECDLWQGNICGARCTSLWSMINGHTTPIFYENSHERPFSIVSKANTFGFLTKKWSPPEIKECDLWQGNICGVRFTSLWSMIKKEFKLKTLFKQKKLHARLFFKYYSLHPKRFRKFHKESLIDHTKIFLFFSK